VLKNYFKKKSACIGYIKSGVLRLELFWVPGHKGIVNNEKTDLIVKSANQGDKVYIKFCNYRHA